jgi:zinc protease
MRNKNFIIYLIGIFLITITSCSTSNKFPIAKDLVYNPPEVDHFVLKNGIKVYYIQDQELPLVAGTLLIPGGALNWGEFRPGILEALGSQMRLGGAGKLTPAMLDLRLQELSAGISSSVGNENSSFSFSALSKDFDVVLNLLNQVITEPRFDEPRLELWKRQSIEGIEKRKDDPSSIARVALRTLVFGSNTVFGRLASKNDIRTISRLDLLKAHRKLIKPNDAILALKGNLNPEEIKQKLNKEFANWKVVSSDIPSIPKFNFEPKPGVYFLEKDLQQSTVYIAQPGPKRLNQDYATIDVFNTVFGSSGFNSLLVQELREKRGLVYSAYGSIDPDVEVGLNIIAFQTKNDSTIEAIEESLNTLRSIQQSNFKTNKIQDAKDSIKNSFVFRYDGTYELVKRAAIKQLLNYPKDFDQTYLPKIANTNEVDLVKVAKKYWQEDKLIIVVVGPTSVLKSLKKAQVNHLPVLKNRVIKSLKFRDGLVSTQTSW